MTSEGGGHMTFIFGAMVGSGKSFGADRRRESKMVELMTANDGRRPGCRASSG